MDWLAGYAAGIAFVCQVCRAHVRTPAIAWVHRWQTGHRQFDLVQHPEECCVTNRFRRRAG